jgi:phosphatidylglycerophosphate synthase
MFTLISRLPIRELLLRQATTLFAALMIAELFYKWHSFLLEAGGFLLTWFVLDALAGLIARAFGRPSDSIAKP